MIQIQIQEIKHGHGEKKSTFTDDVPIETTIYAGFPSQPCLIAIKWIRIPIVDSWLPWNLHLHPIKYHQLPLAPIKAHWMLIDLYYIPSGYLT